MRRLFTGLLVVAVAAGLGSGCNDLSLLGTEPNISVDPAVLDFGRVKTGDTATATIQIRNSGSKDLKISDVVLLPDPDALSLPADAPGPVNGSRTVGPKETFSLDAQFSPQAAGPLLPSKVMIRSNDPHDSAVFVDLIGKGFQEVTDTFVQPGLQSEADILFVIDDSGSMFNEQVAIGESMQTFIDWVSTTIVDYQIAVTTTDMINNAGAFVGTPTVISPATPDVVGTFSTNALVGTNGPGVERGLAASVAALSEPLLSNQNAGFLRPTAKLYLVYVSDEDDQSPGEVLDFIYFFTNLKGGRDQFYVASIVGNPSNGCATAAAGPRYYQFQRLVQGLYGSICQSNFGYELLRLAFAVSGLYGEFPLQYVPEPVDSLRVWVDDVPVAEGNFYYQPISNSVGFTNANVPLAGALIRAEYETESLNAFTDLSTP